MEIDVGNTEIELGNSNMDDNSLLNLSTQTLGMLNQIVERSMNQSPEAPNSDVHGDDTSSNNIGDNTLIVPNTSEPYLDIEDTATNSLQINNNQEIGRAHV